MLDILKADLSGDQEAMQKVGIFQRITKAIATVAL